MTAAQITAADLAETECIHGLDTISCSICRKALGFKPGTDRHANDCSVIAFSTVTGESYDESLRHLATAGRRNGKGVQPDALKQAFTNNGFTLTATRHSIDSARGTGGTYVVVAYRDRKGHAFAIVNGEIINAGRFTRPGTRYSVHAVG